MMQSRRAVTNAPFQNTVKTEDLFYNNEARQKPKNSTHYGKFGSSLLLSLRIQMLANAVISSMALELPEL